jgi:hypothetical protein
MQRGPCNFALSSSKIRVRRLELLSSPLIPSKDHDDLRSLWRHLSFADSKESNPLAMFLLIKEHVAQKMELPFPAAA